MAKLSAEELKISIHAPRVRCDHMTSLHRSLLVYFNPRTSCEVRLSTLLIWLEVLIISIHAPRVRCDICRASISIQVEYFNPRTSCEVRRR